MRLKLILPLVQLKVLVQLNASEVNDLSRSILMIFS